MTRQYFYIQTDNNEHQTLDKNVWQKSQHNREEMTKEDKKREIKKEEKKGFKKKFLILSPFLNNILIWVL